MSGLACRGPRLEEHLGALEGAVQHFPGLWELRDGLALHLTSTFVGEGAVFKSHIS
jgi:hypothetical protein